jgi:adenosylmethionine-8-amino-7-oxononanoate aminotransferase
MQKLAAYSIFGAYANRPALELADLLAEYAPMTESAVFFTSGGSEGVDTAAKIARRYWQVLGEASRTVIIARTEAYHGMNAFGTSFAGIQANASGWGPLVPDVIHVPYDDVTTLEHVLDREGSRIAAFIGEPIIGAGGVLPPPDGYWERVQELCRARGVLLIADEVVTGFGRTGPWFACCRYGIEPDMIVAAKGITSGYIPLGAVICNERVRDVLWSPEAGTFRHGYTYSGHATACAVALSNLAIIEREQLRERVVELEPRLASAMVKVADSPLVLESRTAGLLASVQLNADVLIECPDAIDRLVVELRQAGILTRGLVGHSLQISPAFVISDIEIDLLGSAISGALERVAAKLHAPRSLASP